VAWDNHGSNSSSPRWNFRTLNLPPYPPSNPRPSNGSTQLPVNSDLSWTGGDPDDGDFVTYDVWFGSSLPLTKIKTNTSGTSCALESLNYSTKYYWKVVAWDNHNNRNTSPLWSFTTKIDTSPPSLAITRPKKGWLYINLLAGSIRREFPIVITTIVIGSIDVTATSSDYESGVNRVEFYLDGDLQYTDDKSPYIWPWNEKCNLFPYLLTVKAYDNVGLSSTLSMRVRKIW